MGQSTQPSGRGPTEVGRVIHPVRHAVVRPLLVATIAAIAATPARADRPVPQDEAVRTLKQLGEPYRNIKWTVFTEVGTIKPPYSGSEFVLNPQRGNVRSFVVVDLRTGHYRFDHETVVPVQPPKPPPGTPVPKLPSLAGARLSFSFDGQQEREFSANTMTTEIPDIRAAGQGAIMKPRKKAYATNLLANGLAFFPLSVWGIPLHDAIAASATPVTIIDTQRGQWIITLTDKHGHLATVTCDLTKGGVISAVDVKSSPDFPLRNYRAELTRLANGLWVPKSTLMYWLPPNAPQADRAEYSNVVVNSDLNPSIFNIHFPPRTQMSDSIRSEVYVTGEGPEGDFAAVKAFIETEGFKYELGPAANSEQPSGYRKWLIAAAVTVGVLAVAFLVWRWRRRSQAVTTGLAIAAMSVFASSAPAQSDRPAADDVIKSQCGFNVTAFTLEYFQRKCAPRPVYDALAPTTEGVEFARLADVLSAHGLKVTFREGVTADELKRAVNAETLAIFLAKPFDLAREYHY